MFFQPVNHLRQIRHSSDALDMLESPPSSAFAASCRSTLRAPTTNTSSDSMYNEDMSIYSPDLSDDSSIHSSSSNESLSSDNSSRPVSPISIPLPATKFSLGVVRGVNLDQYVDQQSRYVFVSLLGKSIYGCVYKAIDTQTHSYVAIKLSLMDVMRNVYLSQNAKQDYDVLESPLLESQLMKPLSGTNAHPHILQLHNEFFSSDFKVHWMVLEYAPNSDLFEQVSERKRLSEEEGRIIFAQLVSALKHIHSTGIVHLDMSLENVLLDEQFNVKVCDFGVARPIPSSSKFPSLYIRSKPGYMAPEVLHRQPFDGRKADVFSLGVMLYCMIIGHKPFEFADRAQISYRLISSGRLEEYLTRSSTMVPLSSDVLDLLSRMLCPEEKRITLEEVAAHPFLHGFKL